MTSQGDKPPRLPAPLDLVADDALDNEIQVAVPPAPSGEEHLLRDAIAPLDSYTEEGVYWADLPLADRVSYFPCRARKQKMIFPTLGISFDVTVGEVEMVAGSE
jgi:hypothetical protein